ncbi:MAG: DUF5615 family PIN-like protein [Methylococcales bacterium]
MRILLDENIPVDFAAELPGHNINTVVGLGWSGVLNGELLKRARGRCEVFVTLDRNIEFQQNIPALPFAVIVVRAISNRMTHLRPLAPAVLEAVKIAKPGQLQRVGA